MGKNTLGRENQNLEWKAKWHDEYLKWIAAFANSDGSVLEIAEFFRIEAGSNQVCLGTKVISAE